MGVRELFVGDRNFGKVYERDGMEDSTSFNDGRVLFLTSFVHVSLTDAQEHLASIPRVFLPLAILKFPESPQFGPHEFLTFQYV